jgi:hypothetical protein
MRATFRLVRKASMNADKPAEHMTLTDVECPFPTRRRGVPHFHTFEVDMTLEAGQTLGEVQHWIAIASPSPRMTTTRHVALLPSAVRTMLE